MQNSSSQPSSGSDLDIFDEPVKLFLDRFIKEAGHSAIELEPITYAAIQRAKEILNSRPMMPSTALQRSTLESEAKFLIKAVLTKNRNWRECRENIKAYSAVLLVGAGVSYGGDMPLTKTLIKLRDFSGAKDWDELRRDHNKCLVFKNRFKTVCDRKEPAVSHKVVALNFPEHILEIICLNWDNLFERAASMISKNLNKINEDKSIAGKRHLWKFHGDIENIKNDNVKGQGGWVFPDEGGYVFNNFLTYINNIGLRAEMFVFLIAGYSEKENLVYEQITKPLEKSPPRLTYRIGLALEKLHEEHYLVGTADFILNKILPLPTS